MEEGRDELEAPQRLTQEGLTCIRVRVCVWGGGEVRDILVWE